MRHAQKAGAEPVGDPDVALAVDVKTAVVDAGLEVLGLRWIRDGEARHVGSATVRHPDAVLLVDRKVKRRLERSARLVLVAFANNPTAGQIALGEVHELALLDAESPNVCSGSDDDALDQPKSSAERDAFWRRQRLAVFVEHRNGLASVVGEPGIVLRINRGAEGATLHPAAGEAGGDRRERLAVRVELGGAALPQRISALPPDGEIVADPKIALAVEHCLAAGAIAAAVELERQHPG